MKKKFDQLAAIGLAGEYLTGAAVATHLGWPYRMQPIADIGIDGEIEVLDSNKTSTGRLVKVQVKAIEKVDDQQPPPALYVDPRHAAYWRSLALPVVVVRPVLNQGVVYWKSSSDGRATKESIAFDFTEEDRLTSSSAALIDEVAVERGQHFDPLVGLLNELMGGLRVFQDKEPNMAALEYDSLAPAYDRLIDRWDFAQQVVSALPNHATKRSKARLANLGEHVSGVKRLMNTAARLRGD